MLIVPPVFFQRFSGRLFFLAFLACGLSGLALTDATAQTVVPASKQGAPFDMTAGHLDYDLDGADGGKITASDNVTISGTQGHLTAQTVTYTLSPSLIMAVGNVVYVDTQSNTLYLDRLQLTGQMEQGVADHLKLAMPKLGNIAHADQAVKIDSTTYVMHNVQYSPCQTCPGDSKPWQIRADKVTYHQDTQSMVYKNAKFDVFGVPVVYLPYFSNQLGPSQPKNGFLAPQFGTSSVFGAEARLGAYYYSSSTNADYTLRTRLMSQRGAQVELGRRQITDTTYSEIDGSYLYDTQLKASRDNLKIIAEKTFAPGVRIGANAEVASDDSYLNQYYGRTDPYLGSTIYGEKDSLNQYLALSATHYQDLDPSRPAAQTAQVLPHFQFEQVIPLNGFHLQGAGKGDGSQVLLSADSVNLTRDDGPEYRRLVTSADYTKPWILSDGSKLTFDGLLRADGYDVDGNAGGDGDTGRILPEGTLKWEKPYISEGGHHTVTPIVMGALSPHGNNPNTIPNEDSVAYELDFSNLFEANRFTGVDRIETGPRLIYGVDNLWGSADRTRWRLFLGQSLRKYQDDDLPLAGGAATTASDYIGYLEANPTKLLAFNSRFRLDNSTLQPRRVDASMRMGDPKKARLLTTYTYLDDGPQQISADLRAPINPRYEIVSRLQEDLQDRKLLLGEAGVIVKRDCYNIEFLARRKGYENVLNSDLLKPSTDFLVNVRLLTLGEDN